jgi:hypothetical protein
MFFADQSPRKVIGKNSKTERSDFAWSLFEKSKLRKLPKAA